ncbi:MAG TPA: DUF4097 family beta strand repeat-containing protein [Chryseolinea sp.]|nr:DUF4097 family beta strand repeat-containing protein [Chryseolinea sp.]
MKNVFNLIIILLSGTVAQAQWTEGSIYLTKSLSKESIKEVYARTSGGGITVEGASDSEARVEVYVKANNNHSDLSKEEVKARIEEDYDLEVTAASGKVTAIAKPKHFNLNSKRTLNIGFKFYVPQQTDTDLNTSGGNISLSKLSGKQDFTTSGGGLTLNDLTGKINGKTSGGNITVSNVRDQMDLSTSGGGIDVENSSGTIRLATSGGNINLEKLKGEINANTSGGSIRAEGISGELITHTSGGSITLRDHAGSVDASTSGGNIDMEIDEIGKYITASNSGGNVKVKMPSNKGVNLKLRGESIHINSLQNFTGDQDEHKVVGKMNGGGIPVDISTSGSITLALQ